MDVDGNELPGDKGTAASVTVWKRFMKTPQGVHTPSYYFARNHLKKMKMQQSMQRERARQRLHQVTLYRKYRQGELPDTISITARSFVEPLMALSTRDDLISRLFLAHLFREVVAGKFEDMRGSIQRMLQETNSSSTAFVYWLLRVLFDSFDSGDDAGKSLMWDAQFLGNAALKSINFHMGAMTIEKQVLLSQDRAVRAPSAKRKAAGEDPVSLTSSSLESWLQLSKIYKSLADEDVVLSIYTKSLSSLDETKKALERELVGQFEDALALYESAYRKIDAKQVKLSATESELLEDSRLECMAKMSDWNAIHQNAAAELGDRPVQSLWKRERDRDIYLYAFLHSALMVKENRDIAKEFVDQSLLLSAESKDVLERDFPADLAFLSLDRDDLGKARYYVTKAYHEFMREWSSLPQIATQGRQAKLLRLQRLVEIEEVLDFVSHEYSFTDIKHLERLLKSWDRRDPNVRDSIVHWDDISTQRDQMVFKIRDHFITMKNDAKTKNQRIESSVLIKTLYSAKVAFSLMMARGALGQFNFKVCDKALKKAQRAANQAAKDASSDVTTYETDHLILKSFLLQARQLSGADAIPRYAKLVTWIHVKEQQSSLKEDLASRRRFMILASQAKTELYNLARDHAETVQLALAEVKFAPMQQAPAKWDAKQTPKRLVLLAYSGMQDFVKDQEAQPHVEADIPKIAKSHLQLAGLLELLVKHQQDTEDKILQDISSALRKVIANTMTAVRLGSRAASDTIPRLLQVLATDTASTGPAFQEQAALLEPWMLLRWISNMLALLSKPEGDYLVPALLAIAKSYPQAVYYQFKITYETLPAQAQGKAAKLAQILKLDLLEKFISALQKMTNPAHRMKDWQTALAALIKSPKRDSVAIKTAAAEMMLDMADPKASFLGTENIEYAKIAAPILQKAFGFDGSKLATTSEAQWTSEIVPKVFGAIKDPNHPRSGYGKVSEFSTWLSRFDSSDQNVHIEIPGQYGGFRKPQPELHVKVASFDPRILIMSSIRRPKRLTVRGDDEKEHNFLVKGGEDLRLDQRVEQLFEVMNEIFANNSATQKRRMSIHTYQVVPMTSRVGMIEWVNGTKPLKSILEESLKLVGDQCKKAAETIHDDFIAAHAPKSGGSGPGAQYGPMFTTAKREAAVAKMKKQLEKIPPTLVRNGIARLSPDPEAFIALRQRAAVSTAVFSVSSWIIGIGDRHLDNFLLNLKNGEIIGIDFGHAFGSATLVLPIPELVPFRMTPQILGMLLPLDAETLLKYNMVHAMTALHASRQTLLNVLDVFVNEPLVDWQTYVARTAAKEKFKNDPAKQLDWFAKRRIELVRKKLELGNPAHITSLELHEGSIADPVRSALVLHARGSRPENVRAAAGEVCSSVQHQVECLMDQATDYNILARAWKGWAAWT